MGVVQSTVHRNGSVVVAVLAPPPGTVTPFSVSDAVKVVEVSWLAWMIDAQRVADWLQK